MTDINKQIEEEAREYANDVFDSFRGDTPMHSEDNKMFCINDFSAGYNACLHSSRWRKVSEGLPEVKDENFFINIKRYDNEFRIDTICVFAEMEDVKGYLEFNNVDSWKPID